MAAGLAVVVVTAAVGTLHDYHNLAIVLGVIALAFVVVAIVEFFKPDKRKPPTRSGGPGGAGGSASVGIGTAVGGKGGRGGDLIAGKDE